MSDGHTFKLVATVKQGTANSPLLAIPYPTLEEARTGARQLLRDDHILRVMIVINDVLPRFAEWVER